MKKLINIVSVIFCMFNGTLLFPVKIYYINDTSEALCLRIRCGNDKNIRRILIPTLMDKQDLSENPDLETFVVLPKQGFKVEMPRELLPLRFRLWKANFKPKPDIKWNNNHTLKKILKTSKENEENTVSLLSLNEADLWNIEEIGILINKKADKIGTVLCNTPSAISECEKRLEGLKFHSGKCENGPKIISGY